MYMSVILTHISEILLYISLILSYISEIRISDMYKSQVRNTGSKTGITDMYTGDSRKISIVSRESRTE
jgi:hypothetical protein